MRFKFSRLSFLLSLGLLLSIQWGGSFAFAGEKMKPEELVAHHLNAIGSPEALSALKSLSASGAAELEILVGGNGNLTGKSRFVSEGDKLSLLVHFGISDYLQDHVFFDGKDIGVAYIRPGARSPLGEFLFTYDKVLKEGLFGGVLSTAWPLLHLKERNPHIKFKGLKKISGHKYDALEYRPRHGSGGVRIMMYFDPETFRHVETTYQVEMSSGLGATPQESARQRIARLKVTESFGNFKTVQRLTLPTQWTIEVSSQGTGASVLWKWILGFNEIKENAEIDAGNFKLN